jgi:phosphatidylserine/phosphatidylglycerophosphate/cardiolipin synthase-like enzyme
VGLYPNPVAHGDAGEFVVLDVPNGTDLSAYTLTDGETSVPLPAVETETVLLSTAANRTRRLVDRPVTAMPGRLELANSGETLRLLRGNETADAVEYADAPSGERLIPAPDGDGAMPARATSRWVPLGATDREPVVADGGRVSAFVLPDAGGLPVEELQSASDRILLGGYTLTSKRVATTLRQASRRNVTVRVLLDGDPVGGMDARQVRLLDSLVAAGVEVRVIGGERARYRFYHPKYAVVDDLAIVTTENWKPSGVGGHASRGWGVVTSQPRILEGLVATYRADIGWRDAIPWREYRKTVNGTTAEPATRTFGTQFPAESVHVDRTRLLVAPDNAESSVIDLLRNANESIWIEQAGVGGLRQPFVRQSVAAARRGVRVRILLGGAWYNQEENQAVADRLNAIAAREGLDLEARLVEPDGRFARLHAKGAVVDDEHVLLGSLNWNNNSARNNREVAVILTGDAVADYYGAVVRADWEGGQPRVSIGLLVAVLVGLVGAGLAARRLGFAPVDRTRHQSRRTGPRGL